MASLSIWHWLIVVGIVILVFRTKKLVDSDVTTPSRSTQRAMNFPFWLKVAAASVLLLCLLVIAKMLTAR